MIATRSAKSEVVLGDGNVAVAIGVSLLGANKAKTADAR